ncbi:MAG: hypothetical protein F9K22_00115 [Bacteroidetes bacterium]|nr:MAG: hypothetical protein F9K22_00115 [Bacteroidota bacterium]
MKNGILAFLLFLTVATAQEKIDFRTVDVKYLNAAQLREFKRWRDDQFRLMKATGLQSEVKSLIIQGNKIRSIIYNTGAISNPGVTGNVLDLVWNGLGYGYEFGPLAGARVPRSTVPGDSVSIVIDGFGGANRSTADGDFAPDGVTKWGWLPVPGYSAPGQNDVASWGARTSDLRIRPSSWPESWYNSIIGEYIYPSFLGGNATVPDEEVYYVVDDSTDKEFDYLPIASIPAHGGLGLDLEVRTMQFANPLAEDIIFLVYTAAMDQRAKKVDKMFFGMFGDPHIGGPNNFGDDAASFIPGKAIGLPQFDQLLDIDGKTVTQRARNMVYSWDPNGGADIPTIQPGYFGYKFLESPNNSGDGLDNDDDGITDEGPFNVKGAFIDGITLALSTGISDTAKYIALYGAPKPRWSGDEDGDWNKENDDVGIDGIGGTGDYGEGDGFPSQAFYSDQNGNGLYDAGEPLDTMQVPGYGWAGSEPNFGFRDVNESDQIGLRSFWSLVFGGNNRPKNDNLMYSSISSEMDTAALALLYPIDPANLGDYIFLYGSGPFPMEPGHRERFSIALLMGSDLKDLLLNSETAQLVLEASYRFAQPPPKPKVTAVAGDGRVTLYWDTNAEGARDPFTGKQDFEGYKIYRSQDYTFKDVFTITDGNGYPFLGKALYDEKARKSAQWHRPWSQAEQDKYLGGFHPVEYRGRFIKYYMGEPSDQSGLRHEYVDSTVTNGVTYYYAVVSFDHGDDSLQLPPSESQAVIQRDPTTQLFKYDINTVAATPNDKAAGIVSPIHEIQKGMTLTQTAGSGTGKMTVKVLNEERLVKNQVRIDFDTVLVNSVKTLAYSVLREVPVVEQFTGNENLFVSLANRNIVPATVRVFNGPDTLAARIADSLILVDSAGGRLRALSAGVLLKTRTYTASYLYYPVIASTVFAQGDANPVFDGVRLYITNDPLAIDSANSFFLPARPNGLSYSVANPTLGAVRYAPLDIRIDFVQSTADTNASGNYIAPADSFGTNNPNTKTVRTPFKIVNATDTIPLQALIRDGATTGKAGRWDIGEEIVILTPPPYRTVANNSMMGITLRKSFSFSNPTITAGTTFTAKMKKPYTGNDAFRLTTTPIAYDAAAADAALKNVIVVPNPYVVASAFEQPSFRQDLRGERAVQFRNLPRECTIRIYTVTGELVRTLHKNDNANYLNWDLLSMESARVGYGLYIYHVETPTGATKIGRLGVIK